MQTRPYYLDFIKNICFKNDKMAFITGPRQVGKTTLALKLLEETGEGKYYNWDDVEFKKNWVKDPKKLIPQKVGLQQTIVFDELHKAPRWKTNLKGVYDLRHSFAHFLVTGSARLDIFRKGGESLFGRYFLLRMHPFTLGEFQERTPHPDMILSSLKRPLTSDSPRFERLFRFGGFPDPYLKADPALWNLWRQSRLERLIREDLLDLSRSQELSLMETCAALLPERVGSPFSVQSVAEDLQVSHPTVQRWLTWFSQLFYLYFVPPYSKKLTRSFKKQPKVYLYDWSEVESEAARFENLVASHFLKACHFWTDSGMGRFDLFYIRDKEKREVDFCITRENKLWLLAECKLNDSSTAPNLLYYAKKLKPSIVLQIVKTSGVQERFEIEKEAYGTRISADAFLTLF